MSRMPGGVSIRPMSAADVEWAKELAEGVGEAPHWPLAAYAAAVNPHSSPMRIALIAELQPQPSEGDRPPTRAGFSVASLVPPGAELELIIVSPSVRRAGVGRALLASLLAELQKARVTEVTLEVRGSNSGARSFYTAAGFRESGLRALYYVDPIEDAIILSRPVP